MFKELPFESLARHKMLAWQKAKSCLLAARMLQSTEVSTEAENRTPQPWCQQQHKKTLAVLRPCKSNHWGSDGREDVKQHQPAHPKKMRFNTFCFPWHLSVTYTWAVPSCPRTVKINTDTI